MPWLMLGVIYTALFFLLQDKRGSSTGLLAAGRRFARPIWLAMTIKINGVRSFLEQEHFGVYQP
jgi:hypothetical protein